MPPTPKIQKLGCLMTHSLFGNLPLISMARPGSDTHKRTSAVQVNATSESYCCQLQEWKDLARWRQDNEYIISGYRTPSGSFWKCLESLKHILNETANVYSHYTTIRRVDYIVFVAFFEAKCLSLHHHLTLTGLNMAFAMPRYKKIIVILIASLIIVLLVIRIVLCVWKKRLTRWIGSD